MLDIQNIPRHYLSSIAPKHDYFESLRLERFVEKRGIGYPVITLYDNQVLLGWHKYELAKKHGLLDQLSFCSTLIDPITLLSTQLPDSRLDTKDKFVIFWIKTALYGKSELEQRKAIRSHIFREEMTNDLPGMEMEILHILWIMRYDLLYLVEEGMPSERVYRVHVLPRIEEDKAKERALERQREREAGTQLDLF